VTMDNVFGACVGISNVSNNSSREYEGI
jgi:hypothetical protein